MIVIESKRLFLRNFRSGDEAEIHKLFCIDEAMRFVGMYPAFTKMEETKERLERWMRSDQRLAITLKERGEVLGYIAVNSEEQRADTRELGFAIRPEFRRQGYIREAVNAVMDHLRGEGIRYVWACCFKENTASENLIRSMGFEFQQEGTYDAVNDRAYESLEFRIQL